VGGLLVLAVIYGIYLPYTKVQSTLKDEVEGAPMPSHRKINFYCKECTVMKKLIILIFVVVTMCLGVQATCQAQEPATQPQEPAVQPQEPARDVQQDAQLEVSVAAICRDVLDREPDGYGTSFPVSVGKLYCFTKVTGAQSPTQITHVWFFDGNERARVDLGVKSSSWRTYSSKIIQPHEIGKWRVDVEDFAGNVLKTLEFEVAPQQVTIPNEPKEN
jgi:hypothetical protein